MNAEKVCCKIVANLKLKRTHDMTSYNNDEPDDNELSQYAHGGGTPNVLRHNRRESLKLGRFLNQRPAPDDIVARGFVSQNPTDRHVTIQFTFYFFVCVCLYVLLN